MIFPRPTIEIGSCIAILQTRYKKNFEVPLLLKTYPCLTYEGERWKGHRLSYHLNISKINRLALNWNKGDDLVLHTCDNVWCINYNHLYLGTQKDNMRDMNQRNDKIKKERALWMLRNKHRVGKKHDENTKNLMSSASLNYWKSEKPKLDFDKRSIGQIKRWNSKIGKEEAENRKRDAGGKYCT